MKRFCQRSLSHFLRLENAGSTALSAPTSVFEDGQQNNSFGVETWMSAEDSGEPPRRAVRRSIHKKRARKNYLTSSEKSATLENEQSARTMILSSTLSFSLDASRNRSLRRSAPRLRTKPRRPARLYDLARRTQARRTLESALGVGRLCGVGA